MFNVVFNLAQEENGEDMKKKKLWSFNLFGAGELRKARALIFERRVELQILTFIRDKKTTTIINLSNNQLKRRCYKINIHR